MDLICGNHYYLDGSDTIVQVVVMNPRIIAKVVNGVWAGLLLDVNVGNLSVEKIDCNGNATYGRYRIHSTMESGDAS